MTISYNLLPEPLWAIIDRVGTLAGGAKLYTWNNLIRTQTKLTYQDAGGNLPNTNPIIFGENGTHDPIFWEFDDADTDQTYFLQAFDADDNLLWTVEDFGSPAGGSGGGGGTTFLFLSNLAGNNVFLNRIGVDGVSIPITATDTFIAPSNHQGLVHYVPSAGIAAVGPDIRFVKNNTTATDSIIFGTFTSNMLADDVTPLTYLQYTSNGVSGETYKYFQFPVCQDVINFSNQQTTAGVWIKSVSGSTSFTMSLRQYFGSGGAPSADVEISSGTLTATSGWTFVTASLVGGNVAGKTLGTCGDSATYFEIGMPLNAATVIQFTKPTLYLGSNFPEFDFETYDQIDGSIQTPRPGDVRISVNSFQPYGWVKADNGTIGNASSGATTRANVDTFPLFTVIWEAMQSNPTYAPIYDSAGAASTYGASARVDYAANKQLSLTKALGQVMAGHAPDLSSQVFTTNFAVSTSILTTTSAVQYGTGSPVRVSTAGTLPTGLSATTTYYSKYLSATTLALYPTIADALASTNVVTFSTDGTGVHSIIAYAPALGIFQGENSHTMTTAELAAHDHSYLGSASVITNLSTGGGTNATAPSGSLTTGSAGSSTPFNVMQPTTFMNVFFKL